MIFDVRLKRTRQLLRTIKELSEHAIIIQIISAVISSVIGIANAVFLGIMVNQLTRNMHDKTSWIHIIIEFSVLIFLLKLMGSILQEQSDRKARLLNSRAKSNMAKKQLKVSYTTYNNAEFRKLYSSVTSGIEFTGGFELFLKNVIDSIAGLITTVIISGGILIGTIKATSTNSGTLTQVVESPWYSVLLIAVIVSPVLLSSKISSVAGTKMQKFFDFNVGFNRRLSYYTDFIYNDIGINRLLRSFDPKSTYIDRASNDINAGIQTDTKLQLQASRVQGIALVVTNIAVGLIYALVGLKAITGAVSLGAAVTAAGTLQLMVENLGTTARAWGSRGASLETIIQYQKLMNFEDVVTSGMDKLPEWGKLTFEFKHVYYRYPGQNEPALIDVSLVIPSNEHIAIVGKNGSGKTTLVKLLQRLIVPSQGVITLNGVDIQTFDYTMYQKLFATVSQKFFLLADTLMENVTMGHFKKRVYVDESLRLSGLESRVSGLKEGLWTPVSRQLSESGVVFSGGERQRVAIARAVYRDAKYFILDEPTSALDPRAEADIFDRFAEITHHRPALFISHRMSSTRVSDYIFVLDQGRLIQQGTHDTLIKENGVYSTLYHAQSKVFQNKK